MILKECTPYYREKLEQGLSYQDYVTEKLYSVGLPIIGYSSKKYQNEKGENKNGWEIKFDDIRKNTGNLYIEIAEKSNSDNKEYVPSGILRNDNTWLYVIGDYTKIYIFSKKQLQKLYNSKTKKVIYKNATEKETLREIENKTRTSKGFLLPETYAEKFFAIRII